MKRRFLQLFLFCATLLIALGTLAQSRPFITHWKCESGSTKFRVPIVGTNFKLVLKKADGTPLVTEPSLTVAAIKDAYTCTVPEAGEYLVEVGPEGVSYTQSIGYDDYDTYGNDKRLKEVVSWGDVAWTTMEGAFAYCENFNINPNAGVPNLQNVKSMRSMFNGCRSFNSNIEDWDVSNVENMRFIFRLCDEFNQPLNKWGSKLSKVTNFHGMFYGCGKFNQPLDKWDVSSATDMENMFAYCTVFDQALNSWDVRSVKTMGHMFSECHAFNKPLDAWGDKVQNVEDMNGIFYHARSFDQSLGNWQLRKCKVLSFSQCGMSVENYEKSLQGWAAQPDIAKGVEFVAENLLYTNAAVAAREKLDDENGADWAMYYDLLIPTNLQGNRPFITRWVAEANETLKIGLNGVNLNITWYAVGSNEKHQIKMPRAQSYKPLEITVPAAGEYLVEVAPQGFVAITTPYMYEAREVYKKYFTSHKRLLEIVQWGDVKWGTMRDAFHECYHVTLGPRAGIPDLSNVKDCTRMFYHCDELNQSVNNWDVSGVTNMESMFDGCLILNQPFDKWDLRSVRLMEGIFNNCRQLNQDFSSWRFPNNSEIGFANSGISSANYDKMLNAWAAADEMPKKLKLVASSLFYTQEGEVHALN